MYFLPGFDEDPLDFVVLFYTLCFLEDIYINIINIPIKSNRVVNLTIVVVT